MEKSHYLGSFVCNISGDKAYLYKTQGELQAEIHHSKGEVTRLSDSQIVGGREKDMLHEELTQLVTTVAVPLLFATYQPDGPLRIFSLAFGEIQKNKFLQPRITFPSKYFKCVRRGEALNKIQKSLQQKQVVVVLNDPDIPLKRVGKTEIVTHYFEEHREEYTHAFWIQALDPWHFQQDIEKMAVSLKISTEKIQEWLSNNTSYLIIFDGIEDQQLIKHHLPSLPKGHIIITSRDNLLNDDPLKIGLFNPEESTTFLSINAKGSEEDAQRVAQSLGHVPSSLYRAIETIEAENLALSNYESYCQSLMEKHAQQAKDKSNLPLRNKDFVGREPGLVALEESFSKNKPVVLAANAGLGGIGKTQIALQYAYRTCPHYNLIWWIQCENMQSSYDDLAQRLGIYLTEEEKKQENALIKRVNLYLEGKPGWLLIFDNAEDEKSLEGLLPQSGGHILITSRNQVWDKTQTEVFGIEVFKREESIDLILKVTSRYDQENEAGQLAEQLQDLPLAIAQAAAYIRETRISIQEYIKNFKEVHTALWKREEATNNYELTVNVTWNISMEKIQKIEKQDAITPQPIALPLMQICSFFSPNDIPREALLLEWLKAEYKASQRNADACVADLNQTLKLLEQFSMIGISETNISVHALVQTVVRDQLDSKTNKACLGLSLKLIADKLKKFSQDRPDLWPLLMSLVAHAKAVIKCSKKSDNDIDATIQSIRILAYLGSFLDQHGSSLEAFHQLKDGRKIAKKLEQSRGNPEIQNIEIQNLIYLIFHEMGLVLQKRGKLDQAKKYYEKAIDSLNIYDGYSITSVENSLAISKTLHQIGSSMHLSGQLDEARKYYEKALAIYQKYSGYKSFDLAAYFHSFGGLAKDEGKLDEALMYYERSLEIEQSLSFADNLPSKAISFRDIGYIFFRQQEFQKALDLYQKAIKIFTDAYKSEKHQEIVKTLYNVSIAYIGQGKIEQCDICLQKAFKLAKEIYDDQDDIDIALLYQARGAWYAKQNNFKLAENDYIKCINMQCGIYGNKHHPRTIELMMRLYLVLFRQEKIMEAYSIFLEIRKIIDCQYKNSNEEVIKEFKNLLGPTAEKFFRNFNYNRNLDHYEKILKIELEILNENHLSVAASYNNIGSAYMKLGDYEKALGNFYKALNIQKQLLGGIDLCLAESYGNIGSAYQDLSCYPEALEYFHKALNIRKSLSQIDQYAAINLWQISEVKFIVHKYDKALKYAKQAFDIDSQLLSEEHPQMALSYNNLAKVHLKMRSIEKALSHNQKAFEISCNAHSVSHSDSEVITILEDIIIIVEQAEPNQIVDIDLTYALCVQTLSLEHELTQKLGCLIYSKRYSKNIF